MHRRESAFRLRTGLFIATLVLTAPLVRAGGSLQIGYIADARVELSSPALRSDRDGDGLSAQLSFDLTEDVFAYGDYYQRDADNAVSDLRARTGRIGVGFATGSKTGAIWAGLNWEELGLEGSGLQQTSNGLGLRAGATLPLSERVYALAELGWFDTDDFGGYDLAAGVGAYLAAQTSLFLDYRYQLIDIDDSDAELTLEDLRLGVRITLY